MAAVCGTTGTWVANTTTMSGERPYGKVGNNKQQVS